MFLSTSAFSWEHIEPPVQESFEVPSLLWSHNDVSLSRTFAIIKTVFISISARWCWWSQEFVQELFAFQTLRLRRECNRSNYSNHFLVLGLPRFTPCNFQFLKFFSDLCDIFFSDFQWYQFVYKMSYICNFLNGPIKNSSGNEFSI